MARRHQLDPSRQHRKPYKRTTLNSAARQSAKFDAEGRVALGGSTYGKVSGPVKLRLMVIRLYLNKRSLTDTLETLINTVYEATAECHHLMPEDHPLLAWEKAKEAQRRTLAHQFRIAQNHFDVTGQYVAWEHLSQTQKEAACERLKAASE